MEANEGFLHTEAVSVTRQAGGQQAASVKQAVWAPPPSSQVTYDWQPLVNSGAQSFKWISSFLWY